MSSIFGKALSRSIATWKIEASFSEVTREASGGKIADGFLTLWDGPSVSTHISDSGSCVRRQ